HGATRLRSLRELRNGFESAEARSARAEAECGIAVPDYGAPRLHPGYDAHLLHRRNDELGAFLDAGWPARRHGLGLGVEADRIRSVLVEVAEAGALPAAERVIGERHRNREVDADHADVHPAGEIACGVAVAREDRDAVAILVLRREPHRLVVVLGAH